MRISSERLSSQLSTPVPTYTLFGAERLLIDFSLEELYKSFEGSDAPQKFRFELGANANFDGVLDEYYNVSLFSPKKILELRVSSTTTKLTNQLLKLIKHHAQASHHTVMIVVVLGELTWQQQKTKWFTTLSECTLTIEHNAIDIRALPRWILMTAKRMNITLSDTFAELIAQTNSYNLLGAYNELKKIALIYEKDASLDEESIIKQLENNSKYSIYSLIDTALSGDSAGTKSIFEMGEYEHMHLVNMLSIQLNQLIAIHQSAKSMSLDSAIYKQRVWKSKIPIIKSALERNSHSVLQKLVLGLGRVERSIKGRDSVPVQQKLLDILLDIAR